jgi:hypothetical protein
MKRLLYLGVVIGLIIVISASIASAEAPRPPSHDSVVRVTASGLNLDEQSLSVASSTRDCTPTDVAYLQWDLSDIPDSETIGTAVLSLTPYFTSQTASATLALHETESNWEEGALTYDNAPAVGALIETVSAPTSTGQLITFESSALASYIEASLADDAVSFALQFHGGCSAGVSVVLFEDVESGASPPDLELAPSEPSDPLTGDGPGGVGRTDGTSNLTMWLKADVGTYTDADCSLAASNGDPIACWDDQSGSDLNVVAASAAGWPSYVTDTLNSQPVVTFDGVDDQLNSVATLGITGDEPRTLIVVANRQSANVSSVIVHTGGTVPNQAFGLDSGSEHFYFYRWLYDVEIDPRPISQHQIYAFQHEPGLSSAYIDGTQVGTIGGAANTVNNIAMIGGRNSDGSYHGGDIAEVIIYDVALNSAQRTLVDNYLSAKYNLAITDDRYAGDNATQNDYDLDVAGVGAESDGSHRVGHSAGLVISSSGILNVGEYVIAGHRTPINRDNTTDVPADVEQRWERAWYVDKTGSVDVTLSFDFSEGGRGGTAGVASNYVLLYSPVNAFSWTKLVEGASSVDGDRVSFTVPDADLADGYYGFGTKDASQSPTVLGLRNFAAQTLSVASVRRVVGLLGLAGAICLAFFWHRRRRIL